ncbi:amino acid ABC transporter substrate-binding protein [Longirhabdus pacifica]|uniref:amino acid ABC transporter substrate-binding protein n=1 Tax=Longirhabdus pacifica TaxID=2305227 RepID=UPI001008B797|nr:amino acid ABC transporter substrate-binding protein [Longirhabdus pacifica]
MKKLFFAMIILSLTFILASCGNNTESSGADQNETDSSEQDLLATIQDEGTLIIGTEGTYRPYTFHDESGALTGFDVEIAKEVANRLGVEAEFKETQWDAMFAGLDAKRFDMIANQVGIKEERLKKYDFSNHYITSSAVLVTSEDNSEVTNFEDIKGLKAAQSLTSNYADIAKQYEAEIVSVEGFNQAIDLLNTDRVDVTINDKITILDYKKVKPDAPVKIAATSEDASQSGFMFRQGNDTLVQAVNEALEEMIEDGTYLEISKKWFGEDVLN